MIFLIIRRKNVLLPTLLLPNVIWIIYDEKSGYVSTLYDILFCIFVDNRLNLLQFISVYLIRFVVFNKLLKKTRRFAKFSISSC